MIPELNKIYQGDCLEFMRTLPDACVDLVITDPPYDAKTHDGARLGKDKIDFAPIAGTDLLVGELLRVSRRWVIAFCSLEQLGDYKKSSGDSWIRAGFWDRVSNMPQMTGDRPGQGGEGVAIMHRPGRKKWNGGGKAALWRFPVERGQKEHPTQKPIAMMQRIVGQFSNEDEIIFDPFAGSGTTIVACEQMRRRWIGCELDPKYINVIESRLAAERSQGKLF
jgi:site-specific DNA-methyltransferase (adenine-specific)